MRKKKFQDNYMDLCKYSCILYIYINDLKRPMSLDSNGTYSSHKCGQRLRFLSSKPNGGVFMIRSQFLDKGEKWNWNKQGIKRKEMDLIEEILTSNGFNN